MENFSLVVSFFVSHLVYGDFYTSIDGTRTILL
jgi:hypothetical protein